MEYPAIGQSRAVVRLREVRATTLAADRQNAPKPLLSLRRTKREQAKRRKGRDCSRPNPRLLVAASLWSPAWLDCRQ